MHYTSGSFDTTLDIGGIVVDLRVRWETVGGEIDFDEVVLLVNGPLSGAAMFVADDLTDSIVTHYRGEIIERIWRSLTQTGQ